MQELSNIFGIEFFTIGNPYYVDNNTLLFGFVDLSSNYNYSVSWDIKENRIKNIVNFLGIISSVSKDTQLLLCNSGGLVGLVNATAIAVKDSQLPNENYLQFSNNQLEYYSDTVFDGESQVYDTTGKLILNLGSQQFVTGKNIIKVNQILPKGVYILLIKSDTEQISKKFMVEN